MDRIRLAFLSDKKSSNLKDFCFKRTFMLFFPFDSDFQKPKLRKVNRRFYILRTFLFIKGRRAFRFPVISNCFSIFKNLCVLKTVRLNDVLRPESNFYFRLQKSGAYGFCLLGNPLPENRLVSVFGGFLRIKNLPRFCALMYNFLMKKNLVLFFLILSFSASLSFSESVAHESGEIYNLDSFVAYRINADDFSDAFYFLSELPLYPSNDIRMPDVVSGAWSLWKANAIEEKRKEEQKKAEVDFIFSVMKLTFDLLSSIDGSQISD